MLLSKMCRERCDLYNGARLLHGVPALHHTHMDTHAPWCHICTHWQMLSLKIKCIKIRRINQMPLCVGETLSVMTFSGHLWHFCNFYPPTSLSRSNCGGLRVRRGVSIQVSTLKLVYLILNVFFFPPLLKLVCVCVCVCAGLELWFL